MNKLTPFQKDHVSEKFQVEANFLPKSEFEVHFEFNIQGPMNQLLCPSPEEPVRQNDLWKSTCLEAFMNQKNGGYLEINCSPSGHWNAYEFDSYRQNMRPAQHITVRLTRLEKEAEEVRFFVQLISEKPLDITHVGLTAVLETTSHGKSYWALRHTSDKADFHHADGWTLPYRPATR